MNIGRLNTRFFESCKHGRSSEFLLCFLALGAIVQVLFSDLFGFHDSGYTVQRFSLVVIMGVGGGVFLWMFAFFCVKNVAASAKVIFPTLTLCLCWALVSLPFRANYYAWVEPGMYILYFFSIIVCGCSLAWSGRGRLYLNFLIFCVALVCSFYGLASLNVYFFATFDGNSKLVDFIPWGFVNIRYWSHIATWVMPLMALSILVGPLRRFRIWRGVVLVGAALWWWILFLTTARGSILAILFGGLVVWLFFGRRSLPWLKVSAQFMIFGAVVWFLLSVIIPSWGEEGAHIRNIQTDASGREVLFSEAWQMSLKRFPLGLGPQSWLTHDPITEEYNGGKRLGHPHNMYLMWAAEYGWLLVIVMVGVVSQAILYLGRRSRELVDISCSSQVDVLVAFSASVSAALLHAGVSSIFMAPGSMLIGFFVLVGFWLLVVPQGKSILLGGSSSTGGYLKFFAGMLIVMFYSLWIVWSGQVIEYYQAMLLDDALYYQNQSVGALPRFWLHGDFPRN